MIRALLMTFFLTVTGSAFAKAQAAEIQLGIVNVQEVLDTVDEGKKAKAKMENEMLKKKNELESRQKEFKKLDDDFEKQKLVLSPGAATDKKRELQDKKDELQKLYFASQAEMQKLESKLMAGILKKIKAVIEKVGKDRSLDLVIEKTEGGLFYYKDGLDITNLVIKEYDKAYK